MPELFATTSRASQSRLDAAVDASIASARSFTSASASAQVTPVSLNRSRARANLLRSLPRSVLLVEDNDRSAELLSRYLRQELEGVEVQVERDPAAVLQRADRDPNAWGAIVVDVTLRNSSINGIDLANQLPRRVPVVLMSGAASELLDLAVQQNIASAAYRKDSDPQRLVALLRELLPAAPLPHAG
jgi:CheY-like chemotaxis protein